MASRETRSRAHQSQAGEQARKRLVQAGLEVFGKLGYERASTRMIADRADVNLASIPYHFGSKEGLYLAVARHICEDVNMHLQPALKEIEAILATSPAPEECLNIACSFLDRMVSQILSTPHSELRSPYMLREQLDPSAAFDILYEGFMKPILDCLASLVVRIRGLAAVDDEARVQACAIFGQTVFFRAGSSTVARFMHWNCYTPEEIEMVRNVIVQHTRYGLE